jgi:UDP:flavonoid glycosyltransferase YjiC (YdhE family)
MRLLFFPSDHGGGFGHIARCLTFAHEAKNRGHTCAFALNDRKYQKTVNAHFNVFVSRKPKPWPVMLSMMKKKLTAVVGNSPPVPFFTEINSLEYQVLRDGLVDEKTITELLNRYMEIANHFKPDVLVGDTNLLVRLLSLLIGIPVVQIVRYAFHFRTADLTWWKETPEPMTPPRCSTLFNPLLDKMGLNRIVRAEDLLRGDLYIVPSIPEIEPIPPDDKSVHVGQLSVSEKDDKHPSWFRELDDSQPLVYVTIGGGAGPVGNKLFFSSIIEALALKDIQVVVSTSNKFDPSSFPNLPCNIRFYKWVPGKQMIARADLVVFHGGYGTTMETVSAGKPSLVIPFQTEQEGNGRRLEQLGCGRVLKLSKQDFMKIEHQWPFGDYSYLVQTRYDLTPAELYDAVDNLLGNQTYVKSAQKFREKILQYGGAKQAVDLLEEI